jgi:hypothetical protein
MKRINKKCIGHIRKRNDAGTDFFDYYDHLVRIEDATRVSYQKTLPKRQKISFLTVTALPSSHSNHSQTSE